MVRNREIIVHIGLHKTGTTYLQQQFFPRLNGVEYFPYDFTFSDLATTVDESIDRKVLISNEGISGLPWNLNQLQGKIDEFRWLDSFETSIRKLKVLFPDAKIVLVLRKQGNLLVSLYKQYIQEGGILPFSEFYCENGVILEKDLKFRTRIELLQELFREVYILNFEEFKEKGDAYFIRFFENLGIEVSDMEVEHKTRQNESVSGVKLTVLRKINRWYVFMPETLKKVFHLLRISPRRVLQDGLSFWNPGKENNFKMIKPEINRKFIEDWEFACSQMYSPQKELQTEK